MNKTINLLIILCFLSLTSCGNENKELTVKNIEIFKDTPVWDLAKVLDNSKYKKAGEILSDNRNLVNYQEPKFGTTLLMRAVSTENYNAVKFLLQNGANPNIVSKTGTTALFRAVSHSWKDVTANEDPKFVKILLENGADPNIPYCGKQIEKQIDPIECGTSPLMHAASRGLNKTKLLLEAGADINYKSPSGKTAAIKSLLMQSVETTHYLIVVNKARVTEPYYFYEFGNETVVNYNKPYLPIELLETWLFDLGSKEHKIKMEIIEEFEKQGQNYRSMKKDPSTIERIKKLYPDRWKEYLEKY
jgi:ankyrin repeat protein